jgi:diacylglycerol kinase (ATP)
MKSSIVLISNPTAKRASDRKIAQASRYLMSKGYKVEVLFTEKKGDAENLAREAIRELPSLIIAAGGDGTFNEVINGIAGSEIPMAILPLGTTNVLAKEIGIPENVEGAMEIAVTGTTKTISLGKIVRSYEDNKNNPPIPPLEKGGEGGFRYFVLMAGIGFDGEAVFGINETFKKISGKGAYIYSGLKVLPVFNPHELTFNIDGKTYSGYSAIISKTAKYGGDFKITPDARLTDPTLYICLFKGKKRLDVLRYVFGIATGSHLRFKDVEYLKAKRIKIDGNAHIQIDGDYFGMTPAKIEVAPDTLRLIYPLRKTTDTF